MKHGVCCAANCCGIVHSRDLHSSSRPTRSRSPKKTCYSWSIGTIVNISLSCLMSVVNLPPFLCGLARNIDKRWSFFPGSEMNGHCCAFPTLCMNCLVDKPDASRGKQDLVRLCGPGDSSVHTKQCLNPRARPLPADGWQKQTATTAVKRFFNQ